jgi:EAL domain-containing protein (putative c-di-GMP-specific phosphodiesterase class I)
MSDDEFTFPDTARASRPPGQGEPGRRPGAGYGRSLHGQVADVIQHVLDDPDPEGEWARSQLRERLAAYPGHPERALLEHLILTRSLTGAAEDATALHPGEGSAGTPLPSDADEGSLDAGRIHRIEEVLENRMVLTALQPVRRLPDRGLIGFEALARFVSTDGSRAATWFRDAAALGLGMDLEMTALESAITAGQEIPAPLLIAVKLSPAAVADARAQYLLLTSALAPDRIVIDFMRHDGAGKGGVGDTEGFNAALDSLRRYGVRFSMDFPGEGLSIGRIREIRPDIIKLGRDFLSGLVDGQAGDATLAVRDLARETGAVLVAEGIETRAELEAVITAGVTAGQGFLLGRPSADPDDWTSWIAEADGRYDGSSPLPGNSL